MTLAVLALAAPASGRGRVAEAATSFTTTGADTYVVPAGVTQLDVTVVGAKGGMVGIAPGGTGAQVSGRITVTPGETLAVFVGGVGVDGSYTGSASGSFTPPGTAGGAGGGGAGGNGRMMVDGLYTNVSPGAGGGGASRIARGATALVVGGGGGGAAGSAGQTGFIYNGAIGASAATGSGTGPPGQAAHTGATTATAGPGGPSGASGGQSLGGVTAGGSGSAGVGGAGGDARHTHTLGTPNYSAAATGGGGGGGGLVGGAGGNGGATSINGSGTAVATGGGGGAGSSLVPAGGTIAVASVGPQVEITAVVTAPSGQVGQLQAQQPAASSRDVAVSWSNTGVTWGNGANRRFTVSISPTTVTANTCTGLAGTATGCSFTASADGPYTVSVTPVTDAGSATLASTTATVTLAAPPDAPTGVTATAGTSSVTVGWNVAVANGSAVTGYVAVADPGPATCTTTTATTCVLGARAGVGYTVRVVAKSAAGDSPPSAATTTVSPATPTVPATPPTPQATLDVDSDGVPRPGSSVTAHGAGFAPYSSVTLTLYSAPVVLTNLVADGTGAFVTQVALPAATATGRHEVIALGVDAAGVARTAGAEVTVGAVPDDDDLLPVTGLPIVALWVLGIGLVAGGAGLARRR